MGTLELLHHRPGIWGNNGMNSFNHYSLGAVAAWLYEYVLGIGQQEDSVGFRRIRIQPRMEVLHSASGYYDTPSGRVAVAWKWEGQTVSLEIIIPPNTTAVLALPKGMALQNGLSQSNRLVSGQYRFLITQLSDTSQTDTV